MKRLLAAVAAAALAFGLAACSGGGSTGASAADVSPAAANAPLTSSAAPTSASSAPASSSSAPASSSSAPTSSTPKPKPKADPKPAENADVPCAAAAAAPGTSACVDISSHRAWLLEGGKVTYGPVSMLPGGKGNATPTGRFTVISKEKVHLSREFNNAPMPNSVFFAPGDAFHTGSLRVPSHGCIHLSATSSLRFFDTLQVGDVVQIIP